MRSLAKPRKITIRGSNGQIYMFLGKPKDDLRKDARLMDFNAIINKLLKANSESRRRQLRTYLPLVCLKTPHIDTWWHRHPNLWRCDTKRGVRVYPMGAQYDTDSTRSYQVL